jgi:hypothetical protein
MDPIPEQPKATIQLFEPGSSNSTALLYDSSVRASPTKHITQTKLNEVLKPEIEELAETPNFEKK